MWGRVSSLPVRRTLQSGLGRLESRPNWQTRMSAPRKQPAASLANFGIHVKGMAGRPLAATSAPKAIPA